MGRGRKPNAASLAAAPSPVTVTDGSTRALKVRIDDKTVDIDLRRSGLELRDDRGRRVLAVLIRHGEGNPFDEGKKCRFSGGRVFFLLQSGPEWYLLDGAHGAFGPQGIGAHTFLDQDYVLQSDDGSFSVIHSEETSDFGIREATRFYHWLPVALGEKPPPPGRRSRLSALAERLS